MAADQNAIPVIPLYGMGLGVGTEFGITIPPGGRIAALVRATSVNGDEVFKGRQIFSTLNAGLAQCRSGQPDVVLVLSGHTENISTADQMSNLVAGTRIIGLGNGTARPTFTWSASTATFLFDVANVSITNCNLEMAGDPTSTTALTVTAPIIVSAAGCGIFGCRIRTSVDGNQLATIPIKTTAAGTDLSLVGCHIHGDTAGECTTFVRLVGADRFLMDSCVLQGATSSTTVGVLQFLTTASDAVIIRRSTFINRKASSIHAVTGMTAATGVIEDCNFGILDDATLAGLGTPGSLMGFRNHTVNLAGEQGVPSTPLSTT
ncbi:MAG: hypothetical protein RLZZ403_73 [Pseudomonadota bacterium]|jgi:hypothetical protein